MTRTANISSSMELAVDPVQIHTELETSDTAKASYSKPFWIRRIFVSLWDAVKRVKSVSFSAILSWAATCKAWCGRGGRKVGEIFWKSKPIRALEAALPGWELGVVAAIAVGIFTLSVNLSFLVAVRVRFRTRSNGLGTLWVGDCTSIERVNKVLHGIINILSTILISQSNYCMQLLASPTRNDVDAAHKKRQWVDIGMPSFRNVWKGYIGGWRIFWWVLLGLGSVPLHLLWNSVIIYSPIAYQYNQLTVTEGFVRGLPIGNMVDYGIQIEYSSEGPGANWPDNLSFLQQDLHNYEHLTNLDCKKKYAQHFINGRSDVIVVTKPQAADNDTSTALGGASAGWGPWPYQWICPRDSRRKLACVGELFKSGEDWDFPDYGKPKVEYCLSKKETKKCRLEYGFMITTLTVAANALKTVCFIATYWLLKRSVKESAISGSRSSRKMQPLITTGDAIASFLEFEDKETVGISMVEKEDFENGIWDLRWVHINPMPWRERFPCCFFRAIGVRRWLIGSTMLLAVPLFPSIFLLTKLHWLKYTLGLDTVAIRRLGIGNPSGLFLFGVWNGEVQTNESMSLGEQPTKWAVLRNIVIANSPQLALSLAYYIWNSHLTVMIAAREYTVYAAPSPESDEIEEDDQTQEVEGVSGSDEILESDPLKPKYSLRVSVPLEGTDQRSTHFLMIPLKYWVPINMLWTLLHWLASQAIFFARVDLLSHWLTITEFSISQVGYSVLGMICFLAASVLVFLTGVGISLQHISNQMPLAATCSAALSAACHPKDPSLRHHEKKVHWGVEIYAGEEMPDVQEPGEKLERCTFTCLAARYPIPDRFYA